MQTFAPSCCYDEIDENEAGSSREGFTALKITPLVAPQIKQNVHYGVYHFGRFSKFWARIQIYHNLSQYIHMHIAGYPLPSKSDTTKSLILIERASFCIFFSAPAAGWGRGAGFWIGLRGADGSYSR